MALTSQQLKQIDQIVIIYRDFPGNGKIAKAQRKEAIEKILNKKLPSSPTDNSVVAKALLRFNDLKNKGELFSFKIIDEPFRERNEISSSTSSNITTPEHFVQEKINQNTSQISKDDLKEVIEALINTQIEALNTFKSELVKLLYFKD